MRCYNEYKSDMDGRNWFTKNILGNIPLVKMCFTWKRKTKEQIKVMKEKEEAKKKDKEGSNQDSLAE